MVKTTKAVDAAFIAYSNFVEEYFTYHMDYCTVFFSVFDENIAELICDSIIVLVC